MSWQGSIGDRHNDPQVAGRIAARLPSAKCGPRAQREHVHDDFTTGMTNVPRDGHAVLAGAGGGGDEGTQLVLVIDLKIDKLLGLMIPPMVLGRTDEVIQ